MIRTAKYRRFKIPITEWEKVLRKLKKYEQTRKLRTDLKVAFDQVAQLKTANGNKQTLNEFINKL